jgi:thiamine-phosphate pyrophosphorylase
MHDSQLTEGARRAQQIAAILALRTGRPETRPLELLWALVLDESHASEALAKAGVTRESLHAVAPLANSPTAIDEVISSAMDSTEPSIAASDAFRQVMAQARRATAQRGRDAQVGTEDLLAALAIVDAPVEEILAGFGLSGERLSAAAESAAGEPAVPIDVDFDIRWRDATEENRTGTLRIIDAAANRAREGLRVLEDYARFTLDEAHLTGRLKACRHALREALSSLPSPSLLRSRDTQADVGTSITTQAETVRKSPAEVAQAACKRVQEALRSLEEFGKLWSAAAAGDLERLRYEMYTIEKALLITDLNRRELAGRRLYFLVSESLCHHGYGPAVRGALAGGVGIVQVREKGRHERRLIEIGRRVRGWTREAGALFIMNDRADLAVATDADGVHLGQDDLPVKEARAIVGPNRLVGVSTHTIEQARQAVLDGADYLGVGPVFSSATKSFETLAGLDFVRQVAAEIGLPWFAIGGIGPENIDAVLEAGAQRIAVGHAISAVNDSESAARILSERLAGFARSA